MTQQLELEIKGERTTNKIRIILLCSFLIPILIGIFTGTIDWEFFVVALIIFIIPFFISIIALKLNIYKPWLKYFCAILEISAVFFVQISNLSRGLENWQFTVQQPAQFAVYFIIIGTSALRFSPRLAHFMAVYSAIVYSAVHIYAMWYRDMTITFGKMAGEFQKLSGVNWIASAVFMITMGIVCASLSKHFRKLIYASKENEDSAVTNLTNLRELVDQTSSTITNLNSLINDINKISHDNNMLTGGHMAAVEETMATMEQIDASVESITQHAHEQVEISDKNLASMRNMNDNMIRIEELTRNGKNQSENTADNARRSESDLTNIVEIIQRIKDSSKEVTEIVSVINDISEKTNLLALNAAIEAARAGEEGRGFSVVADEVSKLAERSSVNASEIEKLILTTNKETEDGLNSIVQTVKVLKEITDGVQELNNIMEEVYVLIKKQSEANAEAVKGIEKIQKMAGSMVIATEEQRNGSREVLTAISSVSQGAEKSSELSATLKEKTDKILENGKNLSEKVNSLMKNNNHFETFKLPE